MPTISSVGPIAVDPNSALVGDGTICHPLSINLADAPFVDTTVYIPFDPANFLADQGGTWVPSNGNIYTNLYYVHGHRVTISIIIGFSQINPPNTVKTIRMRIPTEVSNLAKQGPLSQNPNNSTGFVGSAIVSTDVSLISTTALPAHCVVSGGPIDTPTFANLAISLDSGLFPASPLGGFVVLASCTYILAK